MSSQRRPTRSASAIYPILPGMHLPAAGPKEVGNKAWNLMRLAAAGLPVPPGFVLPASWCNGHRTEKATAERLRMAVADGIARLETATGLTFGSGRHPLLVSVRSGAAISMPGMLETVLDVGLNDETVQGLIRSTGNPRLAWDSYRRLIQGFGEVVDGLEPAGFDAVTEQIRADEKTGPEHRLDYHALRRLVGSMLAHYRNKAGAPFPQSPSDQLTRSVEAVFRSWDAPKAKEYRRLNRISDDIGTAVTVQMMVFGNAGGTSGSGVGFTRNPATGENALYLDFQFNGQGEDVVAGRSRLDDTERLSETLPAVWTQLEGIRHDLEAIFGDVQDFEFTVQEGRLHLLQTRRAKRTDWAAIRIAVDLAEEGLVEREQATKLLDGIDLDKIARQHLKNAATKPLATAVSAGVGVVTGRIALDSASAKRFADTGDPAILVRRDTTTDDIVGMNNAVGILTALGGRTSHAAVVARQLGKVCLVGCASLSVDVKGRQCQIGDSTFVEGDWLSLDGNSGDIFGGRIEIEMERPERELAIIAGWNAATSRSAA